MKSNLLLGRLRSRDGNRVAVAMALLACLLLGPRFSLAQQQESPAETYQRIQWITGPAEVNLGGVARLQVPTGYRFTAAAGTQLWMELCGNPSAGELGLLTPPFDPQAGTLPAWFITLSYDDIGHVPDDEKDDLDDKTATSLLDAIRQGTEQANEERQRRGWNPIHVSGWHHPPFYDAATHNLTWAIKAVGSSGTTVNYDSRVLGRRGVMRVKMILEENQVAATVPTFRMVVGGLSFRSGETHAEFREGDKVAKYGLVGLVTGGAAIAAVKSWKPLVALGALIVAALAAIARKVGSFFGWGGPPQTATAAAAVAGGEGGAGDAAASVLVGCPHCKRINRVAHHRMNDRPKCGGCGTVLVG